MEDTFSLVYIWIDHQIFIQLSVITDHLNKLQ